MLNGSGGCGASMERDLIAGFGRQEDMYPDNEQDDFRPARFGMQEDMEEEQEDFRPARFGMQEDMEEEQVGSFDPTKDFGILDEDCGCGGGCEESGCDGGCSGGCGSGGKSKRGNGGDKHYRTRPDYDEDEDGVGSYDPMNRWDLREERIDSAQVWVDELRDRFDSMSDFERRLSQLEDNWSPWESERNTNSDKDGKSIEPRGGDDERFSPPEHECDDSYPLALSGECPLDPPQIEAGASVYRASNNPMTHCGDTWSEINRNAINLLRANIDLVKWISCTIYGRYDELVAVVESDIWAVFCEKDTDDWDEAGDLLREAIIALGFDDPGRLSGACCAVAHGYAPLGPLVICTDADGIAQLVRAWANGGDAARWCVRIDLACTMLHELAHIIGYTGDDKPHDTCTAGGAYALENSMRWALLKRYAAEVVGGVCDGKGKRYLWHGYDVGVSLIKNDRWNKAYNGCNEN